MRSEVVLELVVRAQRAQLVVADYCMRDKVLQPVVAWAGVLVPQARALVQGRVHSPFAGQPTLPEDVRLNSKRS